VSATEITGRARCSLPSIILIGRALFQLEYVAMEERTHFQSGPHVRIEAAHCIGTFIRLKTNLTLRCFQSGSALPDAFVSSFLTNGDANRASSADAFAIYYAALEHARKLVFGFKRARESTNPGNFISDNAEKSQWRAPAINWSTERSRFSGAPRKV